LLEKGEAFGIIAKPSISIAVDTLSVKLAGQMDEVEREAQFLCVGEFD